MDRRLGPEAAKNNRRRLAEGFFAKYLSGRAILDIGYRGSNDEAEPITENAIGIELDYPGYDGKHLPFPNESQDAVFASHCLEHVVDYRAILADWYRVLKIGGYLIIAVPHRDLYERIPYLPSRFNNDHKRLYNPRSLLAELEDSLPTAGYRIRSLRDIDDDFDYAIPPGEHARGSYEIELVAEKIAIPFYADMLDASKLADPVLKFFTKILLRAISANRISNTADLVRCRKILEILPICPFNLIDREIFSSNDPIARAVSLSEIKNVLMPIVEMSPFDEKWYLERYSDVRLALSGNEPGLGHAHFVSHGYWEGRRGILDEFLFG